MKAVTCPQCGSLISKVSSLQAIVECDYCGAKVIIPREEKHAPVVDYAPADYTPVYDNYQNPSILPKVLAIVVGCSVVLVIFILVVSSAKKRPTLPIPYKPVVYSTPTPKKETNVDFEFGAKGTSAGLFDSPGEITVDASGNIYVSDETLRVQRFDATGKFLNLWNVKAEKNETIDKLAADAEGNIYVLIGGEIVVYNASTGEQKYVLSDSKKHYIDDFILRDDGGMMYVSENGENEDIVQTKGRTVVRRFPSIHTKAAETQIPTQGIRLAVDGKGDIYTVYAIGDIYGTFNYNDEDLMTFHFTPQGKFVNKFAAVRMPSAILVDNQSRIYILDKNTANNAAIIVFSNTGSELKRIPLESFSPRSMAIDRENNLYIINGETIQKLKPVDFKN
jgi:DNA-binding beta-propeller fold protein YncE/DNA-directed RNA polymerase subunit RPC12/RpoP